METFDSMIVKALFLFVIVEYCYGQDTFQCYNCSSSSDGECGDGSISSSSGLSLTVDGCYTCSKTSSSSDLIERGCIKDYYPEEGSCNVIHMVGLSLTFGEIVQNIISPSLLISSESCACLGELCNGSIKISSGTVLAALTMILKILEHFL